MMDTRRLAELVERLIMSGPKAAHVSASETHEIHDDVLELVEENKQLRRRLGQIAFDASSAEDAGDFVLGVIQHLSDIPKVEPG